MIYGGVIESVPLLLLGTLYRDGLMMVVRQKGCDVLRRVLRHQSGAARSGWVSDKSLPKRSCWSPIP